MDLASKPHRCEWVASSGDVQSSLPGRDKVVLTESSVEKSFRKILSTPNRSEEDLDRAEELLDELRPESPLRHRLSVELDELRALVTKA
jgi:hypothetical protein